MKPTPRDVRWLVDQLDDQKRRLKNLENRKPGLAYSSIEDGAIREYDKDGVLGSQTGKQPDGTHGNVVLNGPKPPKPTDPDVTAVPGMLEGRWNGKFAGDVVSPLDLKHVAMYAVLAGEVLDLSKQAGVMTGELGDNVQMQVEAGVYNVYLVAWSKAGRFSDAAGPVPVLVPVAADVDAIQAALDDLDLRYDGVITEAGNLGVRLDTAETDIAGAETRLDEAGTRLDTVFGQVSAVDGKATAASTAASSAQSKADTAKSAADQAAADALAASGVAAGKGKVLVQSAAPGAADRNAVTLWIDTTGGANTPKRWTTGTTWVAVTDKAATDAAAAAATAKSAADAAAAAALAAQQAAGTAQSTADNALTMAGTKARVYYSTSAPSGTASTNDIWRQIDATKNVIGEWYWASGWVKTLVSSQAISNLDVGKLTVGTGIISDLVAEHIAGRSARFIQLDVSQLVAVTGTMSEAVITKLFTDVVMSRKITTQMLAIGAFDNLVVDPDFTDPALRAQRIAASSATITSFGTSADNGRAHIVIPASASQLGFKMIATEPGRGTPVAPGATYRIRYQARTASGTAGTRPAVTCYKADGSSAFTAADSGAYVTVGTSWQWVDYTWTAPDDASSAFFDVQRQAGLTGILWSRTPQVTRMNGGELVVDGSIKAAHADLESFAANTGFVADLTARIVKSDMFVGKEFIGGIFTGATFQTNILPNIGLKLDDQGFRAYGPEGGEPVAEIRHDGGTVYSVTDPATGDTLAGLDAEGGVTGKSLNIEGEAIIGGSPIVGGTNVDSFSTDYGQGILDYMPRAMVARGYRDTTGLAVTNGERAFLELSYDNLPNRAYQIHITPTAIYVPPNGGYTYLNIRHTRDGSRPTLDSPLLHRVSARNGGAGSLLTTFGGTFYDLGAAGKVRYLFSWEAIDGQSTFFGGAGATFRAWVEDIGYAVPETGLGRGDSRGNGSGGTTVTPAPPAPAAPEPENYTQVWTPSGYRSYDGNNHYGYADGKNRMYQGDGPATGMLRSIATFGGGSRGQTITQALSGATVTSMTVEITFPHWYIGAGGTAQLTVHGQASLPSSLPFVTLAATRAKIPRGGRVKLSIPSNRWNEFKSGSLRGIGLGNGGGGNTYYGYAKGSTVRLEIKYTK